MMVNWNLHQQQLDWAAASHLDHYQYDSQFSYEQNGSTHAQNFYVQDPQKQLLVETIDRKRKSTDMEEQDSPEHFDALYDRTGLYTNKKYARQNHSEIEKRRRDKMNAFIMELSTLIPMCTAMNRKLDKLTVLRMAVQHLKTIHGSNDVDRENNRKHAFLSDEELKHLILQAADGFLFVVDCDRGRILFVSESAEDILHYPRSDLTGQSLFDFLHHKDIPKVKEQLLSSDLAPRERLIDAKTMLPVKTELPQRPSRLCSGARRQFFCRMKVGRYNIAPASADYVDLDALQSGKKSEPRTFSVIRCTGYLKTWLPGRIDFDDMESDEINTLSCLVAVGKLQSVSIPTALTAAALKDTRAIEFVWRLTMDGRFSYVDQKATAVLGYLPQELIGTSVYEYYHYKDLLHLSDIHRKVLLTTKKLCTLPYRFKSKDGSFVSMKSVQFSFINPWTKDVEYVVANNTILHTQEVTSSSQGTGLDINDNQKSSKGFTDDRKESSPNYVSSTSAYCSDVHGCLGDGIKPGAGKIGREIVEELQEIQRDGVGTTYKTPSPVACSDASKLTSPDDATMETEEIKSELEDSDHESCENIKIEDQPPSGSEDATIKRPVSSTSSAKSTKSAKILPMRTESDDDPQEPAGDVSQQDEAMEAIISLLHDNQESNDDVTFTDLQW